MSAIKVIQTDARLAKDPELTVEGNKARCILVAISTVTWRDESGEKKEHTSSVRWATFGEAAKNHAQYLTKGSHVNITGTLRVKPPATEGGAYINSYVADEVDYLSTKAQNEALREKHAAAA